MASTWKYCRIVSAVVALVVVLGTTDARAVEPIWGPQNQACCGADPCEPTCVATPPRMPWYVQTDALVLRRDVRGRRQLAESGTVVNGAIPEDPLGATVPVFSTSDLDQPFAGGGRVLIGHTFGESRFQIEASYFTLAAFDSEAAIYDPNLNYQGSAGNMFSSFTNFGRPLGVPGVDYNDVIAIRDHSALQNGEVNLVTLLPTPPGRLTSTVLVGVRYINVEEAFNYYSHSNLPGPAGAVNEVATRTWNNLIGPQIGANAEIFIEDRWWAHLTVKGGILNNNATQNTAYTNINNGVTTDAFHEHTRNVTTYVGEVDLSFLYRWSPNFTARIGYQALWLEGLALAQENFDRDIESLRSTNPYLTWLDHNGRVVYHGVHAGIELAW